MRITLMNARLAAQAVGSISALLLVAALAFQYIGGLAPCPLCISQRWAHVAILLTVALYITLPNRITALLGFVTSTCAATLALFHAGVELDWWKGPESCSGAAENVGAMSGADLLSMENAAPIVKCTEVAWSLAGISMAGWNAIITFLAAGLWLVCFLHKQRMR